MKTYLEFLNGRLREVSNRAEAIVKDALMRLSGVKARRWVSISRRRPWTLWRASLRKREVRDRQSDPDLDAQAEMSVSVRGH